MTRNRARTKQLVHIKALVSFNSIHKGDDAVVEITPRVQAWIDAGMVKVIEDGKDQARPGGAEPDADERVATGTVGSLPPGGEQGEGFGAGAYGSSPGLDQG